MHRVTKMDHLQAWACRKGEKYKPQWGTPTAARYSFYRRKTIGKNPHVRENTQRRAEQVRMETNKQPCSLIQFPAICRGHTAMSITYANEALRRGKQFDTARREESQCFGKQKRRSNEKGERARTRRKNRTFTYPRMKKKKPSR